MQDQIEYLMELIDIQGEILKEKTGTRNHHKNKRTRLTPDTLVLYE